jgi:hypothetical protein
VFDKGIIEPKKYRFDPDDVPEVRTELTISIMNNAKEKIPSP